MVSLGKCICSRPNLRTDVAKSAQLVGVVSVVLIKSSPSKYRWSVARLPMGQSCSAGQTGQNIVVAPSMRDCSSFRTPLFTFVACPCVPAKVLRTLHWTMPLVSLEPEHVNQVAHSDDGIRQIGVSWRCVDPRLKARTLQVHFRHFGVHRQGRQCENS